MRCFGDVFEEEKNIDVDVFVDVLQKAEHRANDASNDVNRPPLTHTDTFYEGKVVKRRRSHKSLS